MGRYDDIIHLPHHVSGRRAQMSMNNRAAQFAPFAALTGYEAALEETVRLTEDRMELSEAHREQLDQCLNFLRAHLSEAPEVRVTYFVPDETKPGGSYRTVFGTVRKINDAEKELIFTDGRRIPLAEVIACYSKLFPSD